MDYSDYVVDSNVNKVVWRQIGVKEMSKGMKYLTIKEKKALVLAGKDVPLCVGESRKKNSYIAKLRGTIFDGSLKNKNINI